MPRIRKDFSAMALDESGEPANCFYCDVAIPKARLEYDHFPIPERAGGTNVVPACIVCHDLKDRISMQALPLEFYTAVLKDFETMSRHGRILYAKMLANSVSA